MFCPSCGIGEQQPGNYCRGCGKYLDAALIGGKRPTAPIEHITANTVLSVMTACASLLLAVLLATFFWGKTTTPVVIYITTGFLFAMAAWQTQIIIRSIMLRREMKKRFPNDAVKRKEQLTAAEINALSPANFEYGVPPSIVENDTERFVTARDLSNTEK